jgi:peptide/nickel transport system substrate-binding protein
VPRNPLDRRHQKRSATSRDEPETSSWHDFANIAEIEKKYQMRKNLKSPFLVLGIIALAAIALVACGTETVIQTVIVEKEVKGDTVVETVIVTEQVEVKVMETVIVPQNIVTEKLVEKVLVATPTAAPADDSGPKSGTLIVGEVNIPAPTYRNSKTPWPASVKIRQWGFADGLMNPQKIDPPKRGEPDFNSSVATGWVVAPDASEITLTLREDIEFHDGWGKLTAHDVAYSMNDIHSEGSTFARRGEFESWVGNWEAIDDKTVKINVRDGKLEEGRVDSWWQILTWENAPSIYSEKVFKEKGPDAAHRTMVSTGPWEVSSWTMNEEINATAVKDHWRAEPRMENLQFVQIAEASTRIAAWKTGGVDITFIPLAFLADALDSVGGSWTVGIAKPRGQHVAFAGNYWIQEPHDPEIVSKEEAFPRAGLDKSLPWVGDPRDEASMQQAKLVRTALAMAVDRDTVVNGVLKGFAEQMTAWLFAETSEYFKDEWQIPYDVDRAKELLVEAGYPDGFTMPFIVPPDSAIINPQVGEAVAQMWTSLGIDVELKNTAYAVNRAALVDRSANTPWLMHDKSFQFPPDRAHGMAVLATRGFSFGIELQTTSDTYLKNKAEGDREKRIQNNIELEDWLHEWMPFAPVIHQFEVWAVRPEVLEWRPLGDDANTANALETAVKR